jgi:hypothetical protein
MRWPAQCMYCPAHCMRCPTQCPAHYTMYTIPTRIRSCWVSNSHLLHVPVSGCSPGEEGQNPLVTSSMCQEHGLIPASTVASVVLASVYTHPFIPRKRMHHPLQAAARSFFEITITVIRKIRPGCRLGWYGYPRSALPHVATPKWLAYCRANPGTCSFDTGGVGNATGYTGPGGAVRPCTPPPFLLCAYFSNCPPPPPLP